MTIEIIPIRMEHVEGFHRALDVVARERRYLAMTEAPPIESTRAFVADNIGRRAPQYVALANGELVGWADVVPHVQSTAAHVGTFGIGVVPGHRGRNLGRALTAHVLEAARARGLSRVELTVHVDNARAIKLYERIGFAHEGIKRKARRIDGCDKDVVLMAIIDLDQWAAPAERA